MRDFVYRTDIAATPAAVWAVLADMEHWPQWTASMRSVTRLDSGPLGLDSKVRVVQPGLLPAVYTITAWEPARKFDWASSAPGVHIVAGHVIEPEANGCRITLSIHFGGLFGGIAGMLFSSRIHRFMTMEGEGLKQRSEGK